MELGPNQKETPMRLTGYKVNLVKIMGDTETFGRRHPYMIFDAVSPRAQKNPVSQETLPRPDRPKARVLEPEEPGGPWPVHTTPIGCGGLCEGDGTWPRWVTGPVGGIEPGTRRGMAPQHTLHMKQLEGIRNFAANHSEENRVRKKKRN